MNSTFPPWPKQQQKPSTKKRKDDVDKAIDIALNGGGGIVSPETIASIAEPEVQEILKDEDNVSFKPNPGPQTWFLAASEREVLIGGGKGSSKSFGLMVDPLRYAGCKSTRAVIIRRTIPDVRDIVFKAKILYPKAYPGVQYRDADKMFVFPSGARIEFGYAETESDLARYQGQNYTYIGIDEVADFPFAESLLTYMRANLRTVDPIGAPPILRLTANPGAISSSYIKKEFVNQAPYNTTFWTTTTLTDPRTKEKKTVNISKKYIHSTVFDNPHLLQDDTYLATLASLPEVKRKQWLEGDWDISESSCFPEFDRNLHVVAPYELPRDYKRLKGADWGFSSPGCVVWGAVTPNGQLVIYREYVFQKKDAMTVSQEGKAMELGEMRSMGILDASAWQQRGTLGESIGEVLQRNWPSWSPSSRSRVANTSSRAHRTNLIHQYLAVEPSTGLPRMVIFPNCRKLIEAITAIPTDESNPECMDTDSPFDHYTDALSYLLQGRPTQLRGWSDPFERRTEPLYRMQDASFGY